MQKDQRDLLLEFNAWNVRYLIVGGYAYSFYTEPRATKDLDVYISTSDENVQRVFVALASFGAPLGGITAQDFQDPKGWFQIGTTMSRIDIVQNIDAVRFISVEDFITNKLAVGRLRDLADVEDVRAAEAANTLHHQTVKKETGRP